MDSYLPIKEGRLASMNGRNAETECDRPRQRTSENPLPRPPGAGAFVLLNGLRFQVIGSLPHLGRGDNTWVEYAWLHPFPRDGTYFVAPREKITRTPFRLLNSSPA